MAGGWLAHGGNICLPPTLTYFMISQSASSTAEAFCTVLLYYIGHIERRIEMNPKLVFRTKIALRYIHILAVQYSLSVTKKGAIIYSIL